MVEVINSRASLNLRPPEALAQAWGYAVKTEVVPGSSGPAETAGDPGTGDIPKGGDARRFRVESTGYKPKGIHKVMTKRVVYMADCVQGGKAGNRVGCFRQIWPARPVELLWCRNCCSQTPILG